MFSALTFLPYNEITDIKIVMNEKENEIQNVQSNLPQMSPLYV